MLRNWTYFVIIVITYMLLVSCVISEPTAQAPLATHIADSLIKFGELKKADGFTEGTSFQQTVTVWNCGNPLQRSDSLNEVRTVEKAIEWYIVGEIGADVEASVIAASATVNGTIAGGYTLEVTDQLERSRSLELPVSPYSSVEYVVEWRPVVWSGFLPFIYQSSESRIEYQYEKIAFGEVKDFHDRTEEDCGKPSTILPLTATVFFTPESTVATPLSPNPTLCPYTLKQSVVDSWKIGDADISTVQSYIERFDSERPGDGGSFPIGTIVPFGVVVATNFDEQDGEKWREYPVIPIVHSGSWGLFQTTGEYTAPNTGACRTVVP